MQNNKDLMVYLVAGLLESSRRGFDYPYPGIFQYGLNRLSIAMLQGGNRLPVGANEWINMFEHPLEEWWPGELPAGVSPQATLLFDKEPEEWLGEFLEAIGVTDILSNQHLWYFQSELDQVDMRSLRGWCQDKQKDDLYIGVREFIIRNPYTTASQWADFVSQFPYKLPFDMNSFYVGVGLQHLHQSKFWECPHCKGVLTWSGKQPRCVRHSVCGKLSNEYEERKPLPPEYVKENLYVLKMGQHWRTCVPGIPEVKLYDWACQVRDNKVGLENVAIWPDVDRYDLRLKFSDGEFWAVDVKDLTAPFRLRKTIQDVLPDLERMSSLNGINWDRFFFVVPSYRLKWIPGYTSLARPENLSTNIQIVGLRKFASEVAEKLGQKISLGDL